METLLTLIKFVVIQKTIPKKDPEGVPLNNKN